jgi:CRAL/TRIO-like protein
MAQQALPGRPGNLTREQEDKLLLLWTKVLNISGVGDPNDTDPKTNGIEGGAAQPEPEAEHPKKKLGFWSSKKSSSSHTPASPSANSAAAAALDDKYGQTQEYFDAIATLTPEQLHKTIWNMIKFDDPDAVMLRFLRARKWALVMLVSTMKWRLTEMHVDEDVMVNGEEHAAAEAEKDPKGFMKDFITHFRMGKTYLHGVDKGGHPLCITRVRLHKPGELPNDVMERYTIFILEQGRMTVRPPVDTAVSNDPDYVSCCIY